MIKISTSILSSNNRVDSIKKLNDTNCNYIHIDVMDNKFVQNYQFPIEEINKLIPLSTKKIDIHLMVEDPLTYINKINNSNIVQNLVLENREKLSISGVLDVLSFLL